MDATERGPLVVVGLTGGESRLERNSGLACVPEKALPDLEGDEGREP